MLCSHQFGAFGFGRLQDTIIKAPEIHLMQGGDFARFLGMGFGEAMRLQEIPGNAAFDAEDAPRNIQRIEMIALLRRKQGSFVHNEFEARPHFIGMKPILLSEIGAEGIIGQGC